MAIFKVDIDQAFIKQLTNLGERSDVIARLMLDDSCQILADELENEIRSKHSDTGELADSIEVSETKYSDGSWSVWAYPAGRAKGKRRHKGKVFSRSKKGTMTTGQALYNSDKLFFIEYGTSKQPARPFMDRVVKNSKNKIMKNMQSIFEKEVKKL